MSDEMAEREPLLALQTYVPTRTPVRIDDTIYEMVLLREFSAARRQRVINIWGRVSELLERMASDDELSADEELLIEDGYERMIRAAFPTMPREVIAKLDAVQKEQLVNLFFTVTGATATQEASPEPSEETGAS